MSEAPTKGLLAAAEKNDGRRKDPGVAQYYGYDGIKPAEQAHFITPFL